MITEEQFVDMMVEIEGWFSLDLNESTLRHHLKEIYCNYLEEVGPEEPQTSLNFTLGNCPNCGAISTSIMLSTQTNNPIWLCNFLCKECHFGAWGRGENPNQAIEKAKEDWIFD